MGELFWLGRYSERVDYHARLIDASFQAYQESSGFEADRLRLWYRLLEALEQRDAFHAHCGEGNEKTILHYLTLEPQHPNSIASCLAAARNNARAVRERIPEPLWESINETYLQLRRKQNVHEAGAPSPSLFYQRLKERIALFYGLADSSMLRRNEWHVLQCGRYVERADNTLRILKMLAAAAGAPPDPAVPEYQRLLPFLQAVDGLDAFRKLYALDVTAEKAYRLLLLESAFPRSVAFSLAALERSLEVMQNLEESADTRADRARRLLKRLQALLWGVEGDARPPAAAAAFLNTLLPLCSQLGTQLAALFAYREEETAP